jgi:hypothetical protein
MTDTKGGASINLKIPKSLLSSSSSSSSSLSYATLIAHIQSTVMSLTTANANTSIDAEKVAFIEAALKNGVLLFGEFTLKSGRSVPTPYLLHRTQRGS